MSRLHIVCGNASTVLGADIAHALGGTCVSRLLERFPDGELRIELQESVRGGDVYLVQSTCPPVDAHLVELLLLADACRRAGARRLTAVVPYFGYARHDRRGGRRAPVAARAVADLLQAMGVCRVVAVDVHTQSIEGFFGAPLEHLTAVPLLAQSLDIDRTNAVIVSPDLGGTKLADRYAQALNLPLAVIHKHRISGSEVKVRTVVGDVSGCVPIIVDDMISTAGTMVAAAEALLEAGCQPEIHLVASHALFVGPALERLSGIPIRQVVTTDSVSPEPAGGLPHRVIGLGNLLAQAIRLLHDESSLSELVTRG